MLKVGDILCGNDSYSMSFRGRKCSDFYKVVGITQTGKNCKISRLKNKYLFYDDNKLVGEFCPSDEYWNEKDILNRRVMYGSDKQEKIKIKHLHYALKWDGNPIKFDNRGE